MSLPSSRRWLLALAMVAIGGCPQSSPSSNSSSRSAGAGKAPAGKPSSAAAPTDGWARPAARTELKTTHPANSVRELNGTINRLQKNILAGKNPGAGTVQLIDLLGLRAHFLGRLEDYDAAEELAEEIVRLAPSAGEPLLARARLRSALHRFDEALADLDAAEKLGFQQKNRQAQQKHHESLQQLRLGALHGSGQLQKALELARAGVKDRPDRANQLTLALIEADLGHVEEADRHFAAAERAHRDPTPFPLAFIHQRRGQMWEQAGNVERARLLYEAALERLPEYPAALSRLAGLQVLLGETAPAEQALRRLVEATDDPDYPAQLAELIGGRAPDESAALVKRARDRFEQLVSKHATAFSDHAARFFLGPGKDPQRAMALAETNLQNRRTPEAFQLAIRSALAAGKTAPACARADQVLKLEAAPRWLYLAAAGAYERCGQGDRAAEARKKGK